MLKIIGCIFVSLLFCFSSFAVIIKVRNIAELNTANKNAKPGDIIILQNGVWNNVNIFLNCLGSQTSPSTLKQKHKEK